MVTVVGTYQNGFIKLDKDYHSKHPVKVILTFLEEIPDQTEVILNLDSFSFKESQKNLENFKGSFSDALIEERRSEV